MKRIIFVSLVTTLTFALVGCGSGTSTTTTTDTTTPSTLLPTIISVDYDGILNVVNIIGTNYVSTPLVEFNGVSAIVKSFTNTKITVLIPADATTGKIAVTIGSNTVYSPNNYVIQTKPVLKLNSFTLSESSYSTSTPHALSGNYNVSFSAPEPSVQFNMYLSNTAVIDNACSFSDAVGVNQPLLLPMVSFTEMSLNNMSKTYTTQNFITSTPYKTIDYTKPTFIVGTLCAPDNTNLTTNGATIYIFSQIAIPITIVP